MVQEIFNNVLFQVVMFILFIYAFGYVISLINKLFYKVTGNGLGVCVATGLIGTPIHELSHAVMCIVFGHKIEEMRLFQPDLNTGVLGYVNHSYNRRNLYQVLGNYFIGVAPIVVGSCFLYLMLYLLMPITFNALLDEITSLTYLQIEAGGNMFSFGFNVVLTSIKTIFTFNAFDFKVIIFFVVCLCIALHMNLSSADIKGSLGSIPLIIILLIIVNVIMYFIGGFAYNAFLEGISMASAYLVAVLSLSLVFSIAIFVLGIIIKLIKKIFVR